MTHGTRADYLGEFEHLVLLAILRLGPQAYGAQIRRTIMERAERSASFGAVYSTLRRLEAKGLVGVKGEEADVGEVGRPRRIFAVTEAGVEALRKARRRIERMSRGVHVPG